MVPPDKQGKSEGFDSCDRPRNLTQIGLKSSIFQPVWPWNLMDDLEKNYRAFLLHYVKLCASSQTPQWIQTEVTVRKRSICVKIGDFLSRVTLKFNGWPWKTIGHLFYATLSLVHHFKANRWIQTGVTVRKRLNRVKMGNFLSPVTLKFDGWPWKTKGHLFYVASNFVHHFIAIVEFNLKLQSGNAQIGSKMAIYCHMWPWNLMNDLEKQ